MRWAKYSPTITPTTTNPQGPSSSSSLCQNTAESQRHRPCLPLTLLWTVCQKVCLVALPAFLFPIIPLSTCLRLFKTPLTLAFLLPPLPLPLFSRCSYFFAAAQIVFFFFFFFVNIRAMNVRGKISVSNTRLQDL